GFEKLCSQEREPVQSTEDCDRQGDDEQVIRNDFLILTQSMSEPMSGERDTNTHRESREIRLPPFPAQYLEDDRVQHELSDTNQDQPEIHPAAIHRGELKPM